MACRTREHHAASKVSSGGTPLPEPKPRPANPGGKTREKSVFLGVHPRDAEAGMMGVVHFYKDYAMLALGPRGGHIAAAEMIQKHMAHVLEPAGESDYGDDTAVFHYYTKVDVRVAGPKKVFDITYQVIPQEGEQGRIMRLFEAAGIPKNRVRGV